MQMQLKKKKQAEKETVEAKKKEEKEKAEAKKIEAEEIAAAELKAKEENETKARIEAEQKANEQAKLEKAKQKVIEPKPINKEADIKIMVEGIVKDDLKRTTINQLLVNKNMARDDGSYIVLPHLKWDVENRA
ncbi:hypothetical protein [Sporosarcina sp. E16_8]|uniref:hypothetical protein n=1 Tax=Sporosarcina sp. E16_8 TaxID=2789295 RepID=UPI001A92A862|nr:hypothetical protein [Sporosarcina sp. E16_8]MBO0587456.1 hypothetical protein [Sporosarcina sp. E16_8]